MKSSKNRFDIYREREEEVVRRIREIKELGAQIVKVNEAPDGETYDRVIILKPDREWKVEIQITDPAAFQKYRDVRLDVLSAFRRAPGSAFASVGAVKGRMAGFFLDSVEVLRYGKLYESEAETLAFFVPPPVDILWLYSLKELQRRRTYFVMTYGVIINKKTKDENWESCFVPVPERDAILGSCRVRISTETGWLVPDV